MRKARNSDTKTQNAPTLMGLLLLLSQGWLSVASVLVLLLSHFRFAHSHGFSAFSHRELHALVKSQRCLKGPSHEHLQGGISFGIGAFNLVGANSSSPCFFLFVLFGFFCSVVSHGYHTARLAFVYLQTLSLFPPRILKVLEFAGFSGDKV